MEEKEEIQPKFSLDILDIIKSAQSQNGLRHGDYKRYRQYLTRRGCRIRKSLKFTHGKGSKFVQRVVNEETATNSRHVLLLLSKAERAWAHAMERKEEGNGEGRSKHHVKRLLLRASKLADSLRDVSESVCDDKTALEAQAYASWMKGNALLETETWKEALKNFIQSKTVYEQLTQIGLAGQRRLYSQRVEEIEPSIRYCEYNLQHSGDKDELLAMEAAATLHSDDPAIDLLRTKMSSLLEEWREKQAESFTSLEFNGKVVELSSENIKKGMLMLQESGIELRKQQSRAGKRVLDMSDVAQYDSVLMACNDVIGVINREISNLIGKRKGAVVATDAEKQELELVLDYAKRALCYFTNERNLKLIDLYESVLKQSEIRKRAEEGVSPGIQQPTLSTVTLPEGLAKVPQPLDIARLYNKSIANLSDLKSLGLVESERSEIDAMIVISRGHMQYYLAKASHFSKKWDSAMSLLEKSESSFTDGLAVLGGGNRGKDQEGDILANLRIDIVAEKAKAEGALEYIRELKCVVHADYNLDQNGVSELSSQTNALSLDEKSSLAENLDSFASSSKVISLPPNLVPLAVKPAVFDLAGAYIETPDLDSRTKEKKGTWFSFWR